MKWIIGIIVSIVCFNIYVVMNESYTLPYAIAHCVVTIPALILVAWQRGDICPFDNPPTDKKG